MSYDENKNYTINDLVKYMLAFSEEQKKIGEKINTLQTDVSTLKSDVSTLKTDFKIMNDRLDRLENTTRQGFETLNKKIDIVEETLTDMINKKQDKLEYA